MRGKNPKSVSRRPGPRAGGLLKAEVLDIGGDRIGARALLEQLRAEFPAYDARINQQLSKLAAP